MSVDVTGFRPANRSAGRLSPAGPLIAVLCLALGLAIGLLSPPRLGAEIEAALFPVLTGQSIPPQTVTRTGRWLCWSWIRDKRRSPALLGLDVVLDTADGDRSEPEIVDSATGLPWHTGGALPPGHYETPFCLVLPEFVQEGQPVRVRQVLTYRGVWGLWSLDVPLPEIVAN